MKISSEYFCREEYSVSESRVKYFGSIALRISDALVELMGIYAGSLGAFASTLVAD